LKRKVAIIGGGMGGLAAAFDLTRTQELRDAFDVTVYQLGWRLGGKAASSRDGDGRILEHGLHVWFGSYENAFELVRAAYADWDNPHKDQAILDPEAAFQAKRQTVLGSGDCPQFFQLDWLQSPGKPGDMKGKLSFWSCVTQMLKVIQSQYAVLEGHADEKPQRVPFPPDIQALMALIGLPFLVPLESSWPFYMKSVSDSLVIVADWARKLEDDSLRNDDQLLGFVRQLRTIAATLISSGPFREQPIGQFLAALVDVGTAIVKGAILDMEIGGASVADLDRIDFREWLSQSGADRDSVYGSSIVHALYDTAMQYREGDSRRPSFGAGTGAQVSIRLFGSYKDAFAYESAAGLGEVVITPIYRVLKNRDVRFEFFHKLKRIELNREGNAIAAVYFDRQVNLCERRKTYDPTLAPEPKNGNLECWPDTPRWNQIENGGVLESEGLDLESYWCLQSVGEVPLRQGNQFEDVILAVPIGAFKQLHDREGPCAELIRASKRFRQMTEAASLVPTISVQAWLQRQLVDLGWPPSGVRGKRGSPCDFPTSTGPRPLNIWSDRTSVLGYEYWPSKPRPTTLQYLCDVLETSLYREPPDQTDVPERALRLARRKAIEWLEEKSRVLWPLSTTSPDGEFDWNVLFDRQGREGCQRILDQWVKPNVDPWACCAGSPAGSTQWRLPADGSGFKHLYLAGAWIDTGFNAECIEAAVMSGRQAARAITRSTEPIVGEDFLSFEPSLIALIGDFLRDADAVIEGVARLVFSDHAGELGRRGARARRQHRRPGQ
jgi:uncharacterized protein with NAD-binding domain and iron-sulfur cluster